MRCPNCEFTEIGVTPQLGGLVEYDCDRCDFTWDNEQTPSEIFEAVRQRRSITPTDAEDDA